MAIQIDLQQAIIVVNDIRGLTKFTTGNTEHYVEAKKIIEYLWKVTINEFSNYLHKPLGDGILLIRLINSEIDNSEFNIKLLNCLDHIRSVDFMFYDLFKTEKFNLGWGATVGLVHKLSHRDWYGPDINKAFRLCDYARPKGRILDYEDFKGISNVTYGYNIVDLKVRGFSEMVKVLCTTEVKI